MLMSVLAHAKETVSYNFTYDANGNLIQDNQFYYEYNNFNQLKRVRENNATGEILEEYMYDHEGQRILKQTGSETTFYISENFIRVSNSSGVFDTVYYYDEKDLVARKDPDGKKFFYHPDHLGSTTLITNESGDVVEEVTYEPYGKIIEGGNDRFLYTGKELDKATNLEYYGARYYSPELGKFVEPDSNLPNVYDPQQLNRYSYVRNNPLKYTDPDGRVGILAVAGIGAAFGGVLSIITQIPSGQIDLGRVGISVGAGTGGAVVGFLAASYIPAGTSAISLSSLPQLLTRIGVGTLVSHDIKTIGTNVATGQDPAANTGKDDPFFRNINKIMSGQGDFSDLFVPTGQEVGPILDLETMKIRDASNTDRETNPNIEDPMEKASAISPAPVDISGSRLENNYRNLNKNQGGGYMRGKSNTGSKNEKRYTSTNGCGVYMSCR